MTHFLLRLALNVIALYAATQLVPGIVFSGQLWALVVVAIIFGLVNAVVRPVLLTLGCLINMLTLGLFTFVVNALMLMLTAYLSDLVGPRLEYSFKVDGFVAALLGALVISIVSAVLSFFIRENRRR